MGGNKVAAPSSQPAAKKPSATTVSAAPKLGVGKASGSTNGLGAKKLGGGDNEDTKALQE